VKTPAASFAVAAATPRELVSPLNELARNVNRPTGGVVFLSGDLAREATRVAHEIARTWPGLPTVIASGAGVMSEHGSFEGQPAASAILFSGLRARAFVARASAPEELGPSIAAAIGEATEGRAASVPLFVSPDLWTPDALVPVAAAHPHAHVFGGGTLDDTLPLVVTEQGGIESGTAAGLALMGPAAVIGVSPAYRPLGDGSLEVTEARGPVVLALGGEPALDALSRVARGLEGRPMVLALFPSTADPSGRKGARARPIRGVDPTRKAVVLGEPIREGARLGFAVLDPAAARNDLDSMLRDVRRRAAGAAMRFGLYTGCAGRGSALYGSSGVDGRLVRTAFPGLPFAGVMSAFEIATEGARPAMHLYTGVLSLFTAPS
jgi:small ligand-binding sensory domain FIST